MQGVGVLPKGVGLDDGKRPPGRAARFIFHVPAG